MGRRPSLGVVVAGFPNMLMPMGPHTALGKIPRGIEHNVEWATRLVRAIRERGLARADATPEAVAAWTDHVKKVGAGLLSNEVESWMTGVNSNVEGKRTRIIARYSGSAPEYRAWCDEVAAKGYRELELT